MNQYRSILTGLALLVLFFTLLNNLQWSGNQKHEIYYSDFLSKLDNGQIMNVIIRDDTITGSMDNGTPFETTAPFDPDLIDKLREKQIMIDITPNEGTPWYINLLLQWGPLLLLIGVWIFFMRRMQGPGKLFSIGKSRAKRYIDTGKVITFKDVAGVNEAKEELSEIIEFLGNPEKFRKLGGRIPKGVLMVGPPGTGKTLLSKAVAGEANVPFFSISGSDFVEMFVGVGASRVRDLFDEGKKNAPCIIFIDEIDAVGRHRGAGLGSGHDEREQTLNQLLVEMDGFDTSAGVIIIAATNRQDILDPAILRPGRFDRQVMVALPDVRGRKEILEVHCNNIKLKKDVDLSITAKGTPGFSGAELANLVNEGALWAARKNKKSVELEDLEWARDKVMMGAERRSLILSEEEKTNTAYHEAGHALVAAFIKGADPVHKITIIPRAQALGVTAFLPEEDRLSLDKITLEGKLTISMGGRAAEELIYKDPTTGALNDIQTATETAYKMICKWGMSEKIGPLTIGHPDSGGFLPMDYYQEQDISEEFQEVVDREVQSLLRACHEKAKSILNEHLEKLHELAKLLLEEETVSGETLMRILNLHTQEA